MIDISRKEIVWREAVATGSIKLKVTTIKTIQEKKVKKGDVVEICRVSGIMGAKMTPQNIPFCHPILLSSVDPEVAIQSDAVDVKCTVRADYKTGVEMEALSCVNSMLLTIWDMVKYLEKDENGGYTSTEISGIRVLEKRKDSHGSQG